MNSQYTVNIVRIGRDANPVVGCRTCVVLCLLALTAGCNGGTVDRREHKNGRLANVLGIAYLVGILAISLSAVPLLILTNVGQD